jgi:hypothetical protein
MRGVCLLKENGGKFCTSADSGEKSERNRLAARPTRKSTWFRSAEYTIPPSGKTEATASPFWVLTWLLSPQLAAETDD